MIKGSLRSEPVGDLDVDAYSTSAEVQPTTRAGYVIQRLLETIPGILVWTMLALPAMLFFFAPSVAAYVFFAYLAYWVLRYFEIVSRQFYEYLVMRRYQRTDWRERLARLNDPYGSILALSKTGRRFPMDIARREELAALRRYALSEGDVPSPGEIHHLVVLATYNESTEILEQSLDAILETDYPMDRVAVCLTVEERSGVWSEELLARFDERYGEKFGLFITTVHPDGIPGEGRVKGANLTWAAKRGREELQARGIRDEQVIVSAFDADTRASRNYFNVLAYTHLTNPGRDTDSYQPILMFLNNVWDVPTVSRLVGFCSTFWTMVESTRPMRLRIFSSHAIGMKALVAAGYWSVVVIPDDSRQFWRMFFAFDGRSQVVPLHSPVYLDAVLSRDYFATLKEQYLQLRRWAYGVIDFPYIMVNNFRNHRISPMHKVIQTFRQIAQFNAWATVPFMLIMVPQFLRSIGELLAGKPAGALAALGSALPVVMPVGLLFSMWASGMLMPPRPPHCPPWARFRIAAEWLLLPVVLPIFICLPAIDAQTRLIFRRYIGFRVTVKSRLSEAHDADLLWISKSLPGSGSSGNAAKSAQQVVRMQKMDES